MMMLGLCPAGPAWIPICSGLPYCPGQQLWLPGSRQQYRDALPLLSPSGSHEQVQFRGQSSGVLLFAFLFTEISQAVLAAYKHYKPIKTEKENV